MVREGPSWDQFDDYVNNTDAFGRRRSPASDIGTGAQLEDLLRLQAATGAFEQPESNLLRDLNDPYRKRVEAAGGAPFEGPIDWAGIGSAIFGGGDDTAARDHALFLERAGLPAGYQPYPVGHGAPQKARGAPDIDPESGFVRDPVTGTYYDPALLPDRTSWAPSETVAPGGVDAAVPHELTVADNWRLSMLDPTGWKGPLPGQTEWTGDLPEPPPISPELLERATSYPSGGTYTSGGEYIPNNPAEGPAAAKEQTTWDKVVEGGGKLLENTALGGIVKGLFPDIWYGAGEAMKGLSAGRGSTAGGGLGQDFSSANGGSLIEQERPSGPGPGFIDLNHNGIDDRLEGVSPPPPYVPDPLSGARVASFPDIPPYNPGRDDEWTYFTNNRLAQGGIVRAYAEGGPVAPEDPRMEVIAGAEDALEKIAGWQKPDERDVAVLKKFVSLFGDGALRQLNDNVAAGMKMNGGSGGRMVRGPGGPTDDAIPAVINGHAPAALSSGEFVMPAAAVAGAGGGDPDKGAEALEELSQRLAAGLKSH